MAKRGLTPVVAIILMVVVAVAAALAFYAWFKAFQSQTQVKVSSASTATVEQTRAPLIVTKLNATNTTGSFTGGGVTIKNLSTSSQTISKFLYRDLSAGATGLTSVSTVAVAISGSGSTHTATAPATWNCTSGDLYYIEIRTDKGSTSSDTIRCV